MKPGLVILFLILGLTQLQAQSAEKDFSLLDLQEKTTEIKSARKARSWNPLSIGYQTGIKFYQKVISEQLATTCAFELTCSRFSSAAVHEFGFVKGYFLTFDRLTRCSQIATLETYPIRLNQQHKIIETPADFRFHP